MGVKKTRLLMKKKHEKNLSGVRARVVIAAVGFWESMTAGSQAVASRICSYIYIYCITCQIRYASRTWKKPSAVFTNFSGSRRFSNTGVRLRLGAILLFARGVVVCSVCQSSISSHFGPSPLLS